MGVDEAMIVAGVGCRRGAPASDIEAAIRAALAHADIAADALDGIATIAAKSAEVGVQAAAKKFGVPLCWCLMLTRMRLSLAHKRGPNASAR